MASTQHPRSGRPGSAPAGFTLVELMTVVALLMMMAAILLPMVADKVDPTEAAVEQQLRSVEATVDRFLLEKRRMPELVAAQWDELVDEHLLPVAPANPLNGSTVVAKKPGSGVGWVWEEKGGEYVLYATDVSGKKRYGAKAKKGKGKGKVIEVSWFLGKGKGKGKG